MSQATIAPADIKTLADLRRRLGGIPLERIWFHPAPGTATEKDVIEAEERENRLCELVDGTLVEKAMGFEESRLAVRSPTWRPTWLSKCSTRGTPGRKWPARCEHTSTPASSWSG